MAGDDDPCLGCAVLTHAPAVTRARRVRRCVQRDRHCSRPGSDVVPHPEQGGMAGSGGSGAAATIQGNVQVDGNIDASGSIMDAGGNSNHHSH